MASDLTLLISSGIISGMGFAMANIMGLSAIFLTISLLTDPGTERPKKTSAPLRASSNVLNFVSTVCPDFHWFILVCRPRKITPSLSTKITF